MGQGVPVAHYIGVAENGMKGWSVAGEAGAEEKAGSCECDGLGWGVVGVCTAWRGVLCPV